MRKTHLNDNILVIPMKECICKSGQTWLCHNNNHPSIYLKAKQKERFISYLVFMCNVGWWGEGSVCGNHSRRTLLEMCFHNHQRKIIERLKLSTVNLMLTPKRWYMSLLFTFQRPKQVIQPHLISTGQESTILSYGCKET